MSDADSRSNVRFLNTFLTCYYSTEKRGNALSSSSFFPPFHFSFFSPVTLILSLRT